MSGLAVWLADVLLVILIAVYLLRTRPPRSP